MHISRFWCSGWGRCEFTVYQAALFVFWLIVNMFNNYVHVSVVSVHVYRLLNLLISVVNLSHFYHAYFYHAFSFVFVLPKTSYKTYFCTKCCILFFHGCMFYCKNLCHVQVSLEILSFIHVKCKYDINEYLILT